MIVFHGTTAKRANKISMVGFLPKSLPSACGSLKVAPTPKDGPARRHAGRGTVPLS